MQSSFLQISARGSVGDNDDQVDQYQTLISLRYPPAALRRDPRSSRLCGFAFLALQEMRSKGEADGALEIATMCCLITTEVQHHGSCLNHNYSQ
jgi:hypothetical protein